ncbi:MAG: tetratricopeptide repeat protein [Planctomycetes bacterium]|nr:tetratricopeptide repeat protein [Planctomycetota bacterium]
MATASVHCPEIAGKKVALTGRFASMSHADAAELIRSCGGQCVPEVTRSTRLLIIGQDGWPLRADGQPTRNLVKARQLRAIGYAIASWTEEEFLQQVCGGESHSSVHNRYTYNQLSRILKVPGQRIRAWARAGLIEPVETIHRLAYFDFRQVSGARTLCELTAAGLSTQRIRDGLEQLRSWVPGIEQPLAQLAALESDGRMLVRLAGGSLAEPSGQLRLNFEDSEPEQSPAVLAVYSKTADEWFQEALAQEDAGDYRAAAEAYRSAIEHEPSDPVLHFNLGNVLFATSELEAAAEAFRAATEHDPAYVEAWNNLGSVLAELGRTEPAIAAFERALRIVPTYADAHYNLADTLKACGQESRAQRHYRLYRQYSSGGPWTDGHCAEVE